MDSSQIDPKKTPLLIGGGTSDCGSTNPKPPHGVPDPTLGDFSNHGLKREYDENVDDDTNNLSIKKSRTENNSQDCNKIVALDAKPLAIVEPNTPKLSRQFWKAGDDEEDVPVPHYCNGHIYENPNCVILKFETLIV